MNFFISLIHQSCLIRKIYLKHAQKSSLKHMMPLGSATNKNIQLFNHDLVGEHAFLIPTMCEMHAQSWK